MINEDDIWEENEEKARKNIHQAEINLLQSDFSKLGFREGVFQAESTITPFDYFNGIKAGFNENIGKGYIDGFSDFYKCIIEKHIKDPSKKAYYLKEMELNSENIYEIALKIKENIINGLLEPFKN